jgi:hypothetical protein
MKKKPYKLNHPENSKSVNSLITRFLRDWGLELHGRLIDYGWYWKIMEKSFSLVLQYYLFRNNPGRIRRWVFKNGYLWSQLLGFCLTVTEIIYFHHFNWSTVYFGIIAIYLPDLKIS